MYTKRILYSINSQEKGEILNKNFCSCTFQNNVALNNYKNNIKSTKRIRNKQIGLNDETNFVKMVQ